MIDPSWIAALGVILFGVGLLGTFYHKNAIVVLMCIELMLNAANLNFVAAATHYGCLLYTSPSPRDGLLSRMPSSA